MFWVHRYDLTFVGMIMFSMCRKKQPSVQAISSGAGNTSLLSISVRSVTYIRPKMEYNSHLWAGASKSALDFVDRIQSRALKLIGDDKVASSITSLGHRRNVSSIVLFWKMLVRTLRTNTTAPGILQEYQAVRAQPCLHCCVPPHKALQRKFLLIIFLYLKQA